MMLIELLSRLRRAGTPAIFVETVATWFFSYDWIKEGKSLKKGIEGGDVILEVDTAWLRTQIPDDGDEKVKADSGDGTAGFLDAKVQGSIEVDTGDHALQLVGDVTGDLNAHKHKLYGIGSTGSKTFYGFTEIDIVTAVRFDEESHEFQQQTLTAWVWDPTAPTDWTTVFTDVDETIEQPQVATPTADPAGGEYEWPIEVELTCDTPGAAIYYTTDGSDPDEGDTLYTEAIEISSGPTTLKARAYFPGWLPSEIMSELYEELVDIGDPVAGMVLWLDANDGPCVDAGSTPATDGQLVQRWNDKSGNGNHASQATSGDRPTLETGLLNGLPGVVFASSTVLKCVADVIEAGAKSIFIVADGSGPILGNSGGGTAYIGNHIALGGGSWSVTEDRATSGTHNWNISSTAGVVCALIWDGTTASNAVKSYADAVAGTTATALQADRGTPALGPLSIGGYGDWPGYGGGGDPGELVGTIYEIIAYDSALSDGDRDTNFDYLAAKWGA